MLNKSQAKQAITEAIKAAEEVLKEGTSYYGYSYSTMAVAIIAVELIKLCGGPEEFLKEEK